MKNHTPSKQFILFLALSVLFGGGAGVLASIQTQRYLNNYQEVLDGLGIPPRLGEERDRVLPGSYQDMLRSVREKASEDMVLTFHRAQAEVADPVRSSYSPASTVGVGTILSSDGWVLTTESNFTPQQSESMVAIVNGETVPILSALVDEQTGAVFAQVGAVDLPVVRFGESENVQVGDWLFVRAENGQLLSTTVRAVGLDESLRADTEEVTGRIQTEANLETLSTGAAAFNGAGEYIGFVEDGEIVPLHVVMPAIRSVLKDQIISRPYLGLTILHQSDAVGSDLYSETGALVLAVTRNAPAFEAGFLPGDLLLRINGEEIGGDQRVEDILLEYNDRDTLRVALIRAEEEVEIDVVLGTLTQTR